MIKRFLSPTPAHVQRWQFFLGLIGGFATFLISTGYFEEIPNWVKWSSAVAGYLGVVLGQFAQKKEDA